MDRPITIADHDGRLLAIGTVGHDQPTTMAVSDDGLVWTAIDSSAFDPRIGPVFAGEPGFGAIAWRSAAPGEIAVPIFLFSADGETWETASPSADCVSAFPPVFTEFGFVTLGRLCSIYEETPLGPLYMLTSLDGRVWTSRVSEGRAPGWWATDGRRLVMLTNPEGGEPVTLWLSDDLGRTWRYIDSPFPESVSVYAVVWGHDRWVARASWLLREGDPDPAVCVSEDGETWQCEVIGVSEGQPGRNFLGEPLVTPTGFVSIAYYKDDPSSPADYRVVLASSTDGLDWTFASVAEMANRIPSGLASTSHGLFAWGETDPDADPSGRSQPYLQLYRAPLP